MIGLQICSVCTYLVFLYGVNLVPIVLLSGINLLVLILISIDLIMELNKSIEIEELERKKIL